MNSIADETIKIDKKKKKKKKKKLFMTPSDLPASKIVFLGGTPSFFNRFH